MFDSEVGSVGQDKIAAVIIYYPYGEVITEKQTLALIKAPVLGHFATDDFFLTSDKLSKFKSTIRKSGVDMTSQTYKARHGFDKPYGQYYQAQSGQLALERTNQFLNQYLN